MESCRKIEARQAEGKTEFTEVNWGHIRSTLGAHLTLRALQALYFSNTAALKHQLRSPKQKKIKSGSANRASHPFHLEKSCCLQHTITVP